MFHVQYNYFYRCLQIISLLLTFNKSIISPEFKKAIQKLPPQI